MASKYDSSRHKTYTSKLNVTKKNNFKPIIVTYNDKTKIFGKNSNGAVVVVADMHLTISKNVQFCVCVFCVLCASCTIFTNAVSAS